MRVKVRKNTIDFRDEQWPGYRSEVQSIAVETSDTHYTVPREEYLSLWSKYSATTPANAARRKPIALGDAVECMLTRLGITKERVQAWTRTKDCGCKARQRWLNQWGYRKQEQLDRVLKKAARWYGIS